MGRGGGGGGLRILPHKSWNVYGYDNQQRVKADEAKHAAETEALQAALQRNEAEFRLGVLRRKARDRQQAQQREGAESNEADMGERGCEEEDEGQDAGSRHAMPSYPAAAAAASSSSSRPMRFVVQQEDGDDSAASSSAAANAAAAGSSSAASAAAAPGSGVPPPQHFTLFSDAAVSSSQQSADMARMRLADSRAKELKHMRTHAPVSMFVESFRDLEKGEDHLRPWYARSEGERALADSRATAEARKQITVKRRTDGRAGVILQVNSSGLPVHRVADPLDEIRAQLGRSSDRHEDAVSSAAAADDAHVARAAPFFDDASAHTAVAANRDIVAEAIAAAKQQAARLQAPLPSHPPQAVAMPPMQRSLSTDSSVDQLPPLQSLSALVQPDSSAGASSLFSLDPGALVPHETVRRSRWDESTSLRFSERVGFTNAEEPMSPHQQAGARPLFAAAATARGITPPKPHVHSVSSSSDSSSSSSSSSDDNEEDSTGMVRRRRSSSTHRSSSSSSRHQRERRGEHEKQKKHRRRRSRSRSRSRSREREREHSKSSKSKKNKKKNTTKRRGRRSHSRSRSPRRHRPTSAVAGAAPSLPAVSALRSADELREERRERERAERYKAAALLQVPVWATAHEHSVTQQGIDDNARSHGGRERARSTFAYN